MKFLKQPESSQKRSQKALAREIYKFCARRRVPLWNVARLLVWCVGQDCSQLKFFFSSTFQLRSFISLEVFYTVLFKWNQSLPLFVYILYIYME